MILHDYQIIGRDWLRKNPQAALFLDMGLGKTAIALCALETRHLPVLVVAPKRVAQHVWPAERALWRPDLSLVVADGGPEQRREALQSGADITVIGRDVLKSVLVRKPPWRTIILDELSGFKSQGVRWRVLKSLRRRISDPYVWGLTGTPAPNGLMDLWAPMYLLDGGKRLLPTLTDYRHRYFQVGRLQTRNGRTRPAIINGHVVKWDLMPGSDDLIHARIKDICLSMSTEGRITLPPVTENTVIVDLPPKVRKIYTDLENDLVANLEILGEVSAGNAAILTTKHSQVTAGFFYGEDRQTEDLHREKINALQEIIDGTGSPVMVVYQYRHELDMIKNALGDLVHTIDEPGVIDSWNDGLIPILAVHPQSAGHGLNLQYGGHTLVWMSLTWNLEGWLQTNKRLIRQGQQNPVVIHVIIAENTVDEAKRRRLFEKISVQQALMEYLERR